MNEFDWIDKHLSPLATLPQALSLKDDAAVLHISPDHELILSTDAATASIHFLKDASPYLVAQKTLRAALSDLAAMGAQPLAYLMNFCRPAHTLEPWLEAFCYGLKDVQTLFGIALIGGDTITTTTDLLVDYTVLGTVPRGQALKRSQAQCNDCIYVTGTIGDSSLGLATLLGHLETQDSDYFLYRHYMPEIRITMAQSARSLINGCIDISDGLIADLAHMAKASGLTACIAVETIPLSPAAKHVMATQNWPLIELLTGGEDFELLMTVSASHAAAFEAIAADIGVAVTCIGSLEPQGTEPVRLTHHNLPMDLGKRGHVHF